MGGEALAGGDSGGLSAGGLAGSTKPEGGLIRKAREGKLGGERCQMGRREITR